jgi:glutaredoxin
MSIILASAPWCGNCGPAKLLLTQAGIEFEEFDISSDDDEAQIMGQVKNLPTLLVNGEIVAVGGQEIKEWIAEQKS